MLLTGASRWSRACYASRSVAVAVAIFDMENHRYLVSAVAGRSAARSACPKPSANSSRSALVTATDRPGTWWRPIRSLIVARAASSTPASGCPVSWVGNMVIARLPLGADEVDVQACLRLFLGGQR